MTNKTLIGFNLGLFLCSIVVQLYTYQHWDLIYTLDASARLLAGGTYLNDVFDNNPPLIYYIGMFTTLLAKWLSLNAILAYKILLYLIIIYSLFTSYYLLNSAAATKNVNNYLSLTLSFCLLILPITWFGEREHLMLILVIPYFFLISQCASGTYFSNFLKIVVSFLAGLGFALKPHFLFSFIFIEFLVAYWQKKWLAIIRLESLIIIAVILLYLLSIYIFMPSYYYDVLPMVLTYYISNKNNAYYLLLTHMSVINFALIMIWFCLRKRFCLTQLLLVSAIGFAAAFILQGKGWGYQALPLVTINALLITLLTYSDYVLADSASSISRVLKVPASSIYYPIIATMWGIQSLIIAIPLLVSYAFELSYYKHRTLDPFVRLTRYYAHYQPIFFFTTLMSKSIPISYYANSMLASRFSTMWLLAGIINQQHQLHACNDACLAVKNKLRNYIIADFQRYQPALVFVDVSNQKAYIKESFDYLNFMQQSLEFNLIWQHYNYLTHIEHYDIYQRVHRPP